MAESVHRPQDRHEFKIAVICALPLEAEMVELVFDKFWDDEGIPYGKAEGDSNAYTTGVVANHNVVLAHMPGIGGNKAAAVATGLKSSYPAIEIAFVIGICGVVPIHLQTKDEIVLGDCIISTEAIQYDFGKQYPRGFIKKRTIEDSLARASIEVRALTSKLITEHNRKRIAIRFTHHLKVLQQTRADAIYPGIDNDWLFQAEYEHQQHHQNEQPCDECLEDLETCSESCDALGCDKNQLIARQRLRHLSSENQIHLPMVHYGRMGSGNTVMKSGQDRDRIAKDGKLAAFEMEGSGVCDIFATIIIKSACDYSDSHKNNEWQRYAAATAACGFKAFLEKWEIQSVPAKLGSHSKSIYVLPLLQNPSFTGRESYLQELEKRIFVQRRSRELAIFGLGGVGKTQLTLAFCQMIKPRYPDCSVFWVSAISHARLQQDYTKIAQACSLPTTEDPVSQVQKYLNSERAGRWILIVDNADDRTILFEDEDCIVDKLPKSESGVILFTTRHKGLAVDLAGSTNTISLLQMEPHEARACFKNALEGDGYIENSKMMMELLEELTYLPLAIIQASSYIVKTSTTIQEYLALIRNTNKELIRLLSREFRDNTRDKESENAVARTWLISFKHIKEEDPNAADILFLVSLLENKAIPLAIFPPLETNGDLLHALGVLTGYSFMSKQEKGGMYDMHRLVHRSVTIWMQIEHLHDKWTAKMMAHLAEIFPWGWWEDRSLWQDLMPHAIRLLQLTKDQPSKDRAQLCVKMCACLIEETRDHEAIAWCSEAVSWSEAHLKDDDPLRLDSIAFLAKAYLMNSQLKKAIDLYEWVVPRQRSLLGNEDPDTLVSQGFLAFALSEAGRINEAIELAEKVVEIQSAILPEDHPDLLGSQGKLAKVYMDDRQIKKAIKILENIVAVEARTLAEDHLSRLVSEHELARAYKDDGQIKKAVKILERVTAVQERTLAEDHLERVNSQHELARAYLSDGQVKRAIEILEKVVAIQATILAEDNRARLLSQHVLANAYEHDGRHDEAISLMQHVLQFQQRILPPDHFERLLSEHRLAVWLGDLTHQGPSLASKPSESSIMQPNSSKDTRAKKLHSWEKARAILRLKLKRHKHEAL